MESSATQASDRLIERARDGSPSARNQLVASCLPWLRCRAKDLIRGDLVRKQDGSDLVQETLHLAVLQLPKFRGRSRGQFRAWLASILKLRMARARRYWGQARRDWNREEPLSPAWGQQAELAESATSMLGGLSRQEERERVERAASWCRPEDRQVIFLHLFEGRGHDQIAAELGVTTTTVRQRYSRAVRRVGEAMQLLTLMTRRGLNGLQQDVIGLHRIQGTDPWQLAHRFQLPEELVARWIAEARPLLRTIAKDGP
jgi:RNA polymerase sigma-70 factor (ECF subfamily)